MEKGRLRWVFGGFTASGVLVLALGSAHCSSSRSLSEREASVAQGVVSGSASENATEWTVQYSSSSPSVSNQGAESVIAAIGPQSSPASCNAGALIAAYGPSTNLAKANCLNSASCFTSGHIPQAQPANTYLSTTTLCATSSTPRPGYVRSPDDTTWTDAQVARVGQTSFLHYFGGSVPAFSADCKTRNFNPTLPEPNGQGYFSIFYGRSDDCGATWPGPAASDGSVPYTKWSWIDTGHNIDWNFDMPMVYVDPYNLTTQSKPYVYVHGMVAGQGRGVAESNDAAVTFTEKHWIGDQGVDKNDGATIGGNMTSTADGTLFYVGCKFDVVRLYYSYDRWQTHQIQTLTWNGGSTACGELNPWPANGSQGNVGPYAVSVSRIAYNSTKAGYARVRVAYPTVVTVGGNQRQAYNVLEVGVPRKGAPVVPVYQNQIATFGGTANSSVLEAGFAEPDPFDAPRAGYTTSTKDISDTAVFWSVEADYSAPPTSLQARYRVVQGAYNYSSARDLSPVSWAYQTSQWVGDYNRSSYYYDLGLKRHNYVLVWPQGEQALPTLSTKVQPHFNIVSVRPPIDAPTMTVEELNFGSTVSSGPAVSSQGPNTLDIFWVDSTGNLQEKSFNNGYVPGLTQIGKPPAAAGGIQGDPAATSWAAGRNDVFMRGNDNRIYQAWRQNGAWNWNPGSLTTQTVSSSPAVASMGANKLHVFARFSDGSVRYIRWTGTAWDTTWTNLGGVTDFDPVATFDSNSLHLFARGGGNCIYHKYTLDGTNWLPGPGQLTWESLCHGLAATTGPAVASWGFGRFDVFAGNSGASGGTTLMHLGYENGWGGEFTDLQTNRNGIVLASAVDAVSWGPERVDVFGKAADGNIWHSFYAMP